MERKRRQRSDLSQANPASPPSDGIQKMAGKADDYDAAPFGGMRKSGMGRELGEEGLDAFRETKHVHLDYVPEAKSYWFPYQNRREEIPR